MMKRDLSPFFWVIKEGVIKWMLMGQVVQKVAQGRHQPRGVEVITAHRRLQNLSDHVMNHNQNRPR